VKFTSPLDRDQYGYAIYPNRVRMILVPLSPSAPVKKVFFWGEVSYEPDVLPKITQRMENGADLLRYQNEIYSYLGERKVTKTPGQSWDALCTRLHQNDRRFSLVEILSLGEQDRDQLFTETVRFWEWNQHTRIDSWQRMYIDFSWYGRIE
jgi:hypothetical protein